MESVADIAHGLASKVLQERQRARKDLVTQAERKRQAKEKTKVQIEFARLSIPELEKIIGLRQDNYRMAMRVLKQKKNTQQQAMREKEAKKTVLPSGEFVNPDWWREQD